MISQDMGDFYIPDGSEVEAGLARTTHLAIGAHQDDLEIMAIGGILECFRRPDRWFTGVVVTDGSGSPRSSLYGAMSDSEMQAVRAQEQNTAAMIGEYAAMIQMKHPSAAVKDAQNATVIDGLRQILEATTPEVVYTHNLADKHPTHVAVVLRVIAALRQLPEALRPRQVIGCEVWRGLDWLPDSDKVAFNTSQQENLQEALLGVFDSQISGGKRYDLATMGRRRANATYFESHDVDAATGLAFGMDLTPLIADSTLNEADYVQRYIDSFSQEVHTLLAQMR